MRARPTLRFLAPAALTLLECCAPAATETPDWDELADRAAAEPILARPDGAAGSHPFGDPPEGVRLLASTCVHLLRLGGREMELRSAVTGRSVRPLELLCSSECSREELGDPTLMRTRHGIRFPSLDAAFGGLGDESHRGQCLASLAQLGFSLDHPLEVDGRRYHLRDVLRDSLAEFHLQQTELEWTAEALARWLPAGASWTNRFGVHCSLASLADELLDRPLWMASCGGSHRLMALSTLLAAHRQRPNLRDEQVARIQQVLARARETALAQQDADGSWSSGWIVPLLEPEAARRVLDDRSTTARVLMTGHLAEWLALDEAPSPAVQEALRRAASSLHRTLENTDSNTAWRSFCPYTHAVLIARRFGPEEALAPFTAGKEPSGSAVRPRRTHSPHPHLEEDS